ncbi:hypothetical protein PFLUV_G00008560 [Perca fluviatilis]|uniref:Uncharacterized protein n=1 Tax=Perca fluviatilis TaxID=8168 RepID=A0A6A5FJU8_PERFL|nr:hypothetical protein PFLUV_G00008560 [Perca fluviatilis]
MQRSSKQNTEAAYDNSERCGLLMKICQCLSQLYPQTLSTTPKKRLTTCVSCIGVVFQMPTSRLKSKSLQPQP